MPPDKKREMCEKRSLKGEKNGMFGSSRTGELNPMFGKRHSDNAKKLQSDIKKGKIPVKDKITQEVIGFVKMDHPNIINRKLGSCF